MDTKQNDVRNTNADRLPPVPMPAEIRWREFRSVYLSPILFLIVAFVAWKLWSRMPVISPIRGIGEGQTAIVASPQDGFIEEIAVPQRGWIEAGKPIATLVPYDPASKLDILQSRLQISRMGLEPTIADRSTFDYERLRVESLRLREELAMARVNLDRAEKMLPRHRALVEEKLLAQDIYEQTLRDRDYYAAEVREKGNALSAIDQRLTELQRFTQTNSPDSNPQIQSVVTALEETVQNVETNWNPQSILAPIGGEVSLIRHAGEFVRAGEQLLVINSPRADHIVAYLKQPMPFDPALGMRIEVVTRRRKPVRFETTIAQIGARVEIITNAVAFVAPSTLVDSGLPLILPVPANVDVRPGEVVDVVWKGNP